MNPNMHRTKIAAVAMATLMAVAAGVVLTGGAAASEWHAYEGDIHPGHAYGLLVPEGAEAIEFAFTTESEGVAKFAVLDPAGQMVGYYQLGESPARASIVSPDEGLYVLYVYEVVDGGLALRVSADEAPVTLALKKLPLARQDVVLARTEGPRALDEMVSAKLDLAPVFVTLLYEGSMSGLDATVASAKGDVVVIQGESGTAFAPGVWSTLSGERVSEPANLDGLAYTVTAKAERFEGTLVLTAVSVDTRIQEEPVPEEVEVITPVFMPTDAALFALSPGEAIAFDAQPGTLVLALPSHIQTDDEEEADPHHGGKDHRRSMAGLVSIYDPSDAVLATVRLDRDTPFVEIELPVAGEYVAYVRAAPQESIFAKLNGTQEAPALRQLEIIETVQSVTVDFGIGGSVYEIALEHTPVDVSLRTGRDSVGTLTWVVLENEQGIVARADSWADVGGMLVGGWMQAYPEHFAAGDHLLQVDTVAFTGSIDLMTRAFLRDSVVEVEELEDVDADSDADEGTAAPGDAPAWSGVNDVTRLVGVHVFG